MKYTWAHLILALALIFAVAHSSHAQNTDASTFVQSESLP